MSSLTSREKAKLEKLFDMSSGYVLDYSDSTIATFFYAVADIDIHADKYCSNGSSKAKKLREFWRLEDDYVVGKTIKEMVDELEEKDLLSTTPYPSIVAEEEQKTQALIIECKGISERLMSGKINFDNLKSSASIFDASYLLEQVKRIEKAVDTDPALAIGTAKELVETCCKTILSERGLKFSPSADIPTLTKATFKELKLVPEGIPEQARGSDVIKRILSNLGTIGNGLAELRGLYGTGHGKDGKTSGLTSRHAKLAVGAATTLAVFLFDTHTETK